MAFRADEAANLGYADAESYLVSAANFKDKEQRERSRVALQELANELGSAISYYPSWHPIVSHHEGIHPITWPGEQTGYRGLDHTKCFVNGFITCPYNDGQAVLDSVRALPSNPAALISARRLDEKFYHPTTTAILVTCEWFKPLESNGMIPLSVAMPLLLEKEIPKWRHSQVGETWETMRRYFLGDPHGSRSSLFVSQETGQAMKKIWNDLIYTGMFGPIMV